MGVSGRDTPETTAQGPVLGLRLSSFFQSSPHSAVLCTGSGWKGGDNTPVFWLLLGSTVHLTSHLNCIKVLGDGKILGRDTTSPADQSDIPYCVTSAQIKQLREREKERVGYL